MPYNKFQLYDSQKDVIFVGNIIYYFIFVTGKIPRE